MSENTKSVVTLKEYRARCEASYAYQLEAEQRLAAMKAELEALLDRGPADSPRARCAVERAIFQLQEGIWLIQG